MYLNSFETLLITKIKQGDRRYENMFFDKYRNIARSYCHCSDEEYISIYVETICDVIISIQTKNTEPGNLTAYVYQIIKNKYNKRFSDTKTVILEESFDKPEEIDSVVSHEMFETIDICMEKLSAKCKEILTLKYYQNMAFEEIATQMNYQSRNSAKGAKHDCLKKLKSNALELLPKRINS